MRKLGLIIGLVFFGQQLGWSQTQECVNKIKKLYEQLESRVNTVNSKQLFEMKFTMDIVYATQEKLDSTSYEAHVISDKSKRYFFGKDTKVYQNEKTTASVSLKNKEIHLFDTPPEEYQTNVAKRYELFEDTLFSAVDYAMSTKGGQVKLFFKPDNLIAKGIQEISFNFGGNQMINSIQTIYYPKQQYKRIRVNYHKIDFNSTTKLLDKKLMANIMRGQKLIPEYKNYTLYDHRKNK